MVCVHNLVLYTGDTAFLTQYYPVLLRVLDTYYPAATSASTSLLVKPDGYGDYAFLPRSGAGSYYNALYVLALRRAAELADILSPPNSSDSARWLSRADAVSASLLSHNFDASVGAFLDGTPDSAGQLLPSHPQDANALSILSRIADRPKAEAILSYLSSATSRPYGNAFFDNDSLSPGSGFAERVYPFVSFFELAARFESTNSETVATAFDQLRRLYGTMARQDPGVTMWEGIAAGGTPYEQGFTSMCHGWSTGVVSLLSSFVLGVRPTGKGFETWEVKVLRERGGVSWARGTVPTPRGRMEVSWTEEEGGLEVSVDAPEGTVGEVWLPVGEEGTRVTVDGAVVYPAGEGSVYEARYGDGYVVVRVGGGRHEYRVWG